MSEPIPRYRAFFAELKRRGVFKLAAVYGAVAFAVLQGADIILPSLGLPERTVTVVVVIALLGFPLAIALAWALEMTPGGVKREGPAPSGELEAIAAQPRSRRWLAGALALAGIAALVGSGWWILARGPGETSRVASASSSVPRIVVLPFTVRGSGEYEYLGEGMVDLLSTKLNVPGELHGVDPRAVLALVGREGGGVPDPERGRAITRRLEAGHFVLGVILEAGGRLRLDASLYDIEGGVEAIAEATAEGDANDVFALVDDVAAQLLLSRGEMRGDPVARIAAVTTDSLSALKDYLQGERSLRAGEFLAAAEAFQSAVAIDSSFALAWYRLSVAYEWLTRDHLVREAAEQAFRHSGRLSEHDRQLLQAAVAARQGAFVEADQRYRSILGTYPDDVEAWFQLGEVLFHYGPLQGNPMSASREAFERVIFYEPDHMTALVHLARISASEGDLAELDSLVERFLALNPEADRAIELRALLAFARGDPDEERRVLADLRHVSDPSLLVTVAFVPVMTRDPETGPALARLLIDDSHIPEMRALGHIYLAYLFMGQGRLADAEAELAAAERFDAYRTAEYAALFPLLPFIPARDSQVEAARRMVRALDPQAVQPSVHPSGYIRGHNEVHRHLRSFLLGLLDARLGDYGAAESYAAELETLESPPRSPSLPEDLSLGVRAYVAWRRGEVAEGLALLDRARTQSYYQNSFRSPYYSLSLQRYLRAMLLADVGRLEESIRWYGSFVEISIFDLVFDAPSHLRRAEIYERLDRPDEAARHYARFIELWSDCDPELRGLVDRAEQRLSQLAAESMD
jgi:tetratricopeptide (TPR) repeat protein